jgi:hypothetical protein
MINAEEFSYLKFDTTTTISDYRGDNRASKETQIVEIFS